MVGGVDGVDKQKERVKAPSLCYTARGYPVARGVVVLCMLSLFVFLLWVTGGLFHTQSP